LYGSDHCPVYCDLRNVNVSLVGADNKRRVFAVSAAAFIKKVSGRARERDRERERER